MLDRDASCAAELFDRTRVEMDRGAVPRPSTETAREPIAAHVPLSQHLDDGDGQVLHVHEPVAAKSEHALAGAGSSMPHRSFSRHFRGSPEWPTGYAPSVEAGFHKRWP